jgi:hypothetical protein
MISGEGPADRRSIAPWAWALGVALLLPAAAGAAPLPCGTPDLLPAPPPAPTDHAPREVEERDAYDTPNAVLSEHFALRWTDEVHVDAGLADALLEAAEVSWDVEIEQMGFPAPATTEAWLFNIYVGSPGPGLPDPVDVSANAYFFTDIEDFPVIVLNAETVADPGYPTAVLPHEFFHAVHWGLDAWPRGGVAEWLHEASATWITPEVFPDDVQHARYLGGYILEPQLPLNYISHSSDDGLRRVRDYGAFIFLRYLSEHVADWTLVRDCWLDPIDGTPDPIVEMRAELAGLGHDFDRVFVEFAAHNAAWDYASGSLYADEVDTLDDLVSGLSPISEEVGPDGTERREDARNPPHRNGYNVIELEPSAPRLVTVDLRMALEGTEGSEATWQALVVIDRGPIDYLPIELVDGEGLLELETLGDEDRIFIVVSASSADLLVEGEEFDYEFLIRVEPVPELPTGEACACVSSGRRHATPLLVVLLPLLLLRRRR